MKCKMIIFFTMKKNKSYMLYYQILPSQDGQLCKSKKGSALFRMNAQDGKHDV